LSELKSTPIALRERGSGTLEVVKSELEKKGISLSNLEVIVRLGGTEGLKNFILADQCLGFLPRRSVMKELKSGELVEIKIQGLSISRKFQFIQRKGQRSMPVYKEFVRFARSYYNK
jgi:DNA-binding transcriptional LysR family regulator